MLTEEQLEKLKNSKSEKEWNSICDAIKTANGGEYPKDWFMRVLVSGLASMAKSNWEPM